MSNGIGCAADILLNPKLAATATCMMYTDLLTSLFIKLTIIIQHFYSSVLTAPSALSLPSYMQHRRAAANTRAKRPKLSSPGIETLFTSMP